MAEPIRMISSMATKGLLAELVQDFEQASGLAVASEAIGGVDAVRRVEAGEQLDVVVLASPTIEQLIAGGSVRPGTRVDLVRSGVAIAVPAGAPRPDVGSEPALKAAVLAARSVGYSTGPSGVAIGRLFERWGIAAQVKAKLVVAPPGVPVGSLLARGEVELGFQQLSELMHLPGIELLGPLPAAIQITTVFSAGIASAAAQPDAARRLIDFMAGADATPAKQRNGMEPA